MMERQLLVDVLSSLTAMSNPPSQSNAAHAVLPRNRGHKLLLDL